MGKLLKIVMLILSLSKIGVLVSMFNESDEFVVLSPYSPEWVALYSQESSLIKKVLNSNRIIAIEHFGSTAVPGLYAKPIVDILVGLNRFELAEDEIKALAGVGYVFVEQSSYCQRFYFKKRGERSFNLSLVLFSGEVWSDCLDVRDYLRVSPLKAKEYIMVKQGAISSGCVKISAYSLYKFKFMKQLLASAKVWRLSKK